ncbi:hypothetical protein WA158_006779 [Blastocystis sp. Blastoise]
MQKKMMEKELKQSSFERSHRFDEYRSRIVDFLYSNGKEMNMDPNTILLSIMFFDRYNTYTVMPKVDIYKAAIICLFIAAKCEEREVDLPSFKNICQPCSDLFANIHEVFEWEFTVLKGLDWNLSYVTTGHFVDMYGHVPLVFDNDILDNHEAKPYKNRIMIYICRYLFFFLELTAGEVSLEKFKPSEIAAGIIASSRAVLRLKPIWRDELTKMTRVDIKENFSIFDSIISIYKQKYPDHCKKNLYGEQVSPENVTNSLIQ